MSKPILAMLEELRALALTGLHYNRDDDYNRERYERLLKLATDEYAELSGISSDELAQALLRDVGYITPKVGCCGIAFDPQGRVLVVKRSDNGKWALPGGYCEVNATPEVNTQREVREETGLEVEIDALVGVFSAFPGQRPHLTLTHYTLAYLCHVTGGKLTPSHETPEVRYAEFDEITDWHSDHGERVRKAFQMWLINHRL